jgi:putative methionine-R-sulfoxide reductase with GAF domain
MVPTFSDVGLILGRLGLFLARSKAAIVYTHHSYIDIAGLDLPVGLYNKFHSLLLGLADHVVASTPTYASLLEASSRESRVSAVRFGVDGDRFQAPPKKPAKFNVLFVGQLRPYKGVGTLLKAWRYMNNADLHIVGSGHERAALEAYCKRLNLKSVHFHGSASEKQLRQFYEDAHVLVLPSNRIAEAFGLVLLEGMSAGCVPVSSDLPGVADVVGSSGYTFPVGNSEALAVVLLELQNNSLKRNEMSTLAVARSFATNWDYTAEAYYGIYQQAYLGRQLELAFKKGRKTQALQHWLEQVARAAAADRSSLMMVRHQGRKLVIAASIGLPPEVAAHTELKIGQRMAGHVAQSGRPMLVRRRQMEGIARIYVKRDSPLTSALILPLRHHGKQIGVLNLARGQNKVAFTEADMHWLHNLSHQVAPLLERYMSEHTTPNRPSPLADGRVRIVKPKVSLQAAS